MPSLDVLRDFFVSLNLLAVPRLCILPNFVTQLLKNLMLFLKGQSVADPDLKMRGLGGGLK